MNHVSVELAKKLKDAGLEWKPDRGDWFRDERHTRILGMEYVLYPREEYIWLPSLSQLLAEIEQRDWRYDLGIRNLINQETRTISGKVYFLGIRKKECFSHKPDNCWYEDTLEEAAGLALLRILIKEKESQVNP